MIYDVQQNSYLRPSLAERAVLSKLELEFKVRATYGVEVKFNAMNLDN